MKSFLCVCLLSALILAACGGNATEHELPRVVEATPTETVSAVPEPTSTPEPTRTPSPPVPTPTFSAGNAILPTVHVPITELSADNLTSRVLGLRMKAIRDLTSVTRVEREYLSTGDFREVMVDLFEASRDEIEVDQLLYETLGLMEPDESLYDILLALSSEGTLGLFDLADQKLYVVQEDEEITSAHERTYVSEYVHYLQAVNFDIKAKLDASEDNDDATRALQAILEGDAAIAEFIYINEYMNPDERAASIAEPSAAFREALDMAPYVAIRTLVFPYEEGLDFAVGLFQSAGGWDAINEALESPPASTEQVLHLEKYAAGELPIRIDMPELGWILGDDWRHVRTGRLGEFFVLAWLETDFSTQAAAIAASGWGGDAYSLFAGPNGQSVLVLPIAWDSDQDAEEFVDVVRQHTEARTGAAWEDSAIAPNAVIASLPNNRMVYAERDGSLTLQIFAPDVDIIETLRQAMAAGLELDG